MKNKITSYGFLLQTTKRKQSLQSCSLGWMHEYVLHLAMVISWMNSVSYHVCTWFTYSAMFYMGTCQGSGRYVIEPNLDATHGVDLFLSKSACTLMTWYLTKDTCIMLFNLT